MVGEGRRRWPGLVDSSISSEVKNVINESHWAWFFLSKMRMKVLC